MLSRRTYAFGMNAVIRVFQSAVWSPLRDYLRCKAVALAELQKLPVQKCAKIPILPLNAHQSHQ